MFRVSSVIRACILIFAAALALLISAEPQTYTVLHRFKGGQDGSIPNPGLLQDSEGNIYGTTNYGGTSHNCANGCGTVFKATDSGQMRVLYNFTRGTDGGRPNGWLIRDPAGNLYGTTFQGGDLACNANGCGVAFKIDRGGTETTLYSFTAGPDGGQPVAGLVGDDAGNLYGVAPSGGDRTCNPPYGCGVVFKLDGAGMESVLHTFNLLDGAAAETGLIRDAQGDFYGVTGSGGDLTCNAGYGCGTVFKLDALGNLTLLHTFTGSDGQLPDSRLVLDAAGNLYGTTAQGGGPNCLGPGCGTVFEVDTTGKMTVLYRFKGGPDGFEPVGGIARDPAGNLYGTTYYGGTCVHNYGYGCGTVFKLDRNGAKMLLHNFAGGSDGAFPFGLTRDAAGYLYGTTSTGGDTKCSPPYGCGAVYKLTPAP
jgi:uncharacterized repeat protein (TIGR03803 family)